MRRRELTERYEELRAQAMGTYLAAYVNTTKHKSLVSLTLSASFEADNRNGMRIKGFSYGNDLRKRQA